MKSERSAVVSLPVPFDKVKISVLASKEII
jgi:hypothetical protein